ncbi:MAG: DUF4402 domain-containing protein [Ignavibacteriae bacterium]|nr:DUF4402 domain-containing protein [Ignavibacteriota bacterium]MCB9220096.1 DUF4402 domain-containing protein [Ignavibacteriales bacterium]
MYTKKNLLFFLAVLIFSGSSAFAQTTADATVKINLKKGLKVENLGSSTIEFDDIVLDGTAKSQTVDPVDGARFLITGHPNRDVTITYPNATLNNDTWADGLTAPKGTLSFVPSVEESGANNSHTGLTVLSTAGSDTKNLVNVSGVGTLYLWVGGKIDIAAGQAVGDYEGDFTVIVAY